MLLIAFDEFNKYEALCTINEVIMAKRPNPKKEKAERNKAYARKFRKKQSRYSFRRGKGYGSANFQKKDEEKNATKSDEQNP
jgi:hypothetical protein